MGYVSGKFGVATIWGGTGVFWKKRSGRECNLARIFLCLGEEEKQRERRSGLVKKKKKEKKRFIYLFFISSHVAPICDATYHFNIANN